MSGGSMNGNQSGVDDPIYESFMRRQYVEGMALASSSDLLRLHIPPTSPPHFVAEFHCDGLVRVGDGEIRRASEFHVGIWFPPDYLRRADGFEMLRMFTPNVWHPNVSRIHPLICIGKLAPGTPFVDIIYQIFEILTFVKLNTKDSLNKDACSWAREHSNEFPIDRRPLKRRALNLEVTPL
jgi:ubiquitin-protein ligase